MAGKIQQYRDAISACFRANPTQLTIRQILAWIDGEYPKNNFSKNVLSSQVYKSCINVPYAQKSSAPKILIFNRKPRTYQLATTLNDADIELEAIAARESLPQPSRGVPRLNLEDHLKTLLVKNLAQLEPGLCLWSLQPPSVEYTFDNGRRVDILAKDISGTPVVIELKRNEAHDKVIGQALLYRGLLKAELGVDRVRIFLVASIMSDAVKTACSTVDDVRLFEYTVDIQTHSVRNKEE